MRAEKRRWRICSLNSEKNSLLRGGKRNA